MNDDLMQRDGDEAAPVPTRWQVALHEAAHAIHARSSALVVKLVTVEGIVEVEGGRCDGGTSLGRCYHGSDQQLDATGRCVLRLVGPVAGYRAGWPEPLLPYDEFVRDAECRHPESDAAKVLAELRGPDAAPEGPRALYEGACGRAVAFVDTHWSEITLLAERFMEVVSLNEEGIELVFDPGWPEFREMLDELARDNDEAPWLRAAMEAAGTDDPGQIVVGPDGGVVS